VKALYGIGEKETEEFRQTAFAGATAGGKGVRFIQVCHAAAAMALGMRMAI
jgi:hypothetical protein